MQDDAIAPNFRHPARQTRRMTLVSKLPSQCRSALYQLKRMESIISAEAHIYLWLKKSLTLER
jgi:hypothetical protein